MSSLLLGVVVPMPTLPVLSTVMRAALFVARMSLFADSVPIARSRAGLGPSVLVKM